jgi:hypothetical protein
MGSAAVAVAERPEELTLTLKAANDKAVALTISLHWSSKALPLTVIFSSVGAVYPAQ